MPFLKQCDGLILDSCYGGLLLVATEAEILGVPTVSTDIDGMHEFMRECNGTLVPDSRERIELGLRKLLQDEAPLVTLDYRKSNERAQKEFEELLV